MVMKLAFGQLYLKDADKVRYILEQKGKWLNETIINASIKILRKPFAKLLFHSNLVWSNKRVGVCR